MKKWIIIALMIFNIGNHGYVSAMDVPQENISTYIILISGGSLAFLAILLQKGITKLIHHFFDKSAINQSINNEQDLNEELFRSQVESFLLLRELYCLLIEKKEKCLEQGRHDAFMHYIRCNPDNFSPVVHQMTSNDLEDQSKLDLVEDQCQDKIIRCQIDGGPVYYLCPRGDIEDKIKKLIQERYDDKKNTVKDQLCAQARLLYTEKRQLLDMQGEAFQNNILPLIKQSCAL